MPYSVEAKNIMMDALAAVALRISVHDANPGSTGASEAAGSTRGTPTWAAASGGGVNTSAAASITNIPAAFTVRYVGMWTTGGVWLGYDPVPDTTSAGGVPWTYIATLGALDLNATPSA